MNRMVPVNTPVFNGNEKKYLMDCIDTGWVSSDGKYIKEFEKGMADYTGRKYAFAVCNGTAALEAAVLSLDIEKGSDVLMPDFTIISCAQAILKAGLNPVPVDCEPDTWNMDVSQLQEKLTKKTKAVMAVHIYGLPADMDRITEFARIHSLYVIEDAAEAQGLTYRGKQCGSFGHVSIFSFYPNKHIVCGEGGMVLTDDGKIAERIGKVRNLFFDEDRRYIHEEIGSNFRMTNMQAAIGLAQLEQIERTVIRKREIGRLYQEGLAGIEGIQLPVANTDYADNIYWVFGIVLRKKGQSADSAMKKLKEYGIGSRHFFYPMHKQPALLKSGCFKDLKDEEYRNASDICENGLYIPSGLGLSKEDQEYVIEKLKKVLT